MKVVHVIASLDNPNAGPSHTVPRLVDALAEHSVSSEIHTLKPAPNDVAARDHLVGYPALPLVRRLGISAAMRCGLALVSADIFHNNGVWMMPNIYVGAVARERRIPLVLAPHGMFSEWAMAFSRWRKQIVWTCLGQRRAVEVAACFHALAESEVEDIRRLGFHQPIAVVSCGVDIPPPAPKPDPKKRQLRRVLFLSRLHPKKGIPLLLKAWAKLGPAYSDWELIIAGSDEIGHLAQVKALAGKLGVQRVSFRGPVSGEAKSALYRSAELFVFPSHSEGFGMVVVEALAHSLPVIATTGTPWEGLHQHGCGWWIELSAGRLAEALRTAMDLPEDQRRLMGHRGRLWIQEAYSWPRIGEEMKGVYEWVLGGGPPPSCVVTD